MLTCKNFPDISRKLFYFHQKRHLVKCLLVLKKNNIYTQTSTTCCDSFLYVLIWAYNTYTCNITILPVPPSHFYIFFLFLSLYSILYPYMKEYQTIFFFFQLQGQTVQHNQKAGVIMSSGDLALQGVTRHQAGNYTCIASNVEGDGESNTVELKVMCKLIYFLFFNIFFDQRKNRK